MSDETTGPSPEEMGLTSEDMKIEKPETKPEKGLEIPMYNPDDQIKLKEGDDFLKVVGTEKTLVGRKIDGDKRRYWETAGYKEVSQLPGYPAYDTNSRGGEGLEWAAKNTDRQVGLHFQGHGLEKGPVESLDKLIENGLERGRTFYSTNFTYTPEMADFDRDPMPFKGGGIIVVSDYDKHFPYEGDPQIKYILVDEQYMRIVDIMQERYAEYGIKVVPWHDVPKVLTEDYNSHNPGKELQPSFLDPESPPQYDFGPKPTKEPEADNRAFQANPDVEIGPNDDPVW